MVLRIYLRHALSLPLHVVLRKAWTKLCRHVYLVPVRWRDRKRQSYLVRWRKQYELLGTFFSAFAIGLLRKDARQIAGLTARYLEHRFDLLGSGWIHVKHGTRCRGLEGFRYDMGEEVNPDGSDEWLKGRVNSQNLSESQRIWQLVGARYIPIDWHRDFKSGYRWSESCWYMDVPLSPEPGVDVKVPWELARMQHLAQLAWAYALAKAGEPGFSSPEAYVYEFRNQVLDFVATNSPRFGVNWRNSMDVGIRVANWLVAFDLFRAYGADFDPEFLSVFQRSVYEHGLHIMNNLEWTQELRGNHYLSDIVGLLFVAAYLPSTPETNAWLAFAVQELVKEVEVQFTPDGANFEASTCYHRLSAEMVTYATALVLGLPAEKQAALEKHNSHLHRVIPKLKPGPIPLYLLRGGDRHTPFPESYMERLEKMAEFTVHMTKTDGHIPQIGDNDSGRFLKLQPVCNQITVAQAKALYKNLENYDELLDSDIYWNEDDLDHRHLVAAINGLFGRKDFTAFMGDGWLEAELIRNLARGLRLMSYHEPTGLTTAENFRIGDGQGLQCLITELNSLSGYSRQIVEVHVPGGKIREQLRTFAYPDFGLYIYCSRRLYLAVHCGPIGQNGNGGHAHNDQLSLELSVDGEDWIRDPGTYLYTPLPARRNEYRSVKAHFAPWVEGREPGCLDLGTFRLGNEAKAECLYFGVEGFGGKHWGYGKPVYRIVTLRDDLIRIEDFAEGQTRISPAYGYSRVENEVNSAGFGVALAKVLPISDKYGSLMK